jgi:hypothetical protein
MGKGKKIINLLYFWVTLFMLCCLPISNKANSISIMLLLTLWLLEGNWKEKGASLLREPFFLLNAALFLLFLISYVRSENKDIARFFIEKNLSLIILPLIFCSGDRFSVREINNIFKAFITCIFLMMFLATILAAWQFILTGNSHVFFYHTLAHHVGLSAITASLLCCISLALLFHLPEKKKLKTCVAAIFSLWLLLLSSRLFIATGLLLLFCNIFYYLNLRNKIIAAALGLSLVTLLGVTHNPIRSRFQDLGQFPLNHLNDTVFSKADYFDGLSLRLLYFRFSAAIMQENGNYLWGTGTGDAENLLKEKIIAHDMYTGNGTTDTEGYLQYSFHNEYLQKLVQLGITGLGLFLAVIVYCWHLAFRYRSKLLSNLLIIFCLSFCTDTLTETQLGLVSYLSFLCLASILAKRTLSLSKKNKNPFPKYHESRQYL